MNEDDDEDGGGGTACEMGVKSGGKSVWVDGLSR